MSDDYPPETTRQRFIRNAGENARTIRAKQRQLEREGKDEDAARIGAIQDKWDEVIAEAQRQEDAENEDVAAN